MGITKREEVPKRSSILSHILFPTSITHGVYVFLNPGSTYYHTSPATALLFTEIINGEGITVSLPLPALPVLLFDTNTPFFCL